jgi:egghead protein (zeste-white 4 protein)
MFPNFKFPTLIKGSYVVTRAKAEKQVSFDNGLEGSTAEDAYFAIKAMDHGITFDFIEGEMWEKSPFTFQVLKQTL